MKALHSLLVAIVLLGCVGAASAATIVPEPTTGALLGLAVLAMARTRRR